jgi:hypothetical protein
VSSVVAVPLCRGVGMLLQGDWAPWLQRAI